MPSSSSPSAYGGIKNVNEDDIVQGCVKWLMDNEELMDLLSKVPGTDTPFIFQDSLLATLEGTQGNALVVSYAGGWAGANTYNTQEFPRISLMFYCDPLRDYQNNVVNLGETRRRLNYIYKKFDFFMHRPSARPTSSTLVEMWGSVRTFGCDRLGEPTVIDRVEDGDYLKALEVFYGVSVA